MASARSRAAAAGNQGRCWCTSFPICVGRSGGAARPGSSRTAGEHEAPTPREGTSPRSLTRCYFRKGRAVSRACAAGVGARSRSNSTGTDDREPLAIRGLGEPLVECHERHRGRVILGGHDRGRELQGVGRAERMDAQEPHGCLANHCDRLDLVPNIGQGSQAAKSRAHGRSRQTALPLESRERGHALDLGRTPRDGRWPGSQVTG